MNKQRHIKSLAEKYGIGDTRTECHKIILDMESNGDNAKKIFNKLPYLGYVYIDVEKPEFKRYFYEWEHVKGFIRCKVISLDQWEYMTVAYINEHLDRVQYSNFICRRMDNCGVRGNVLIDFYEESKNKEKAIEKDC